MVVMHLSSYSLGAFFVILLGYIIQSSFLQYVFYYKSQGNKSHYSWKIQKDKDASIGKLWLHPLFSNKPRGPYHGIFSTINLLLASLFALLVTEMSSRRLNHMRFDAVASSSGWLTILKEVLFAICWQSVLEYYWHRMMHTNLFYATLHKYHHFYKSPEPFDDMYIHPLEAFGYYCILYSPPFAFEIHYMAFITYMIVMGICGVLDHAGIAFQVPLIYNTKDHDDHHLKFKVNYSFPFPFMGKFIKQLIFVFYEPPHPFLLTLRHFKIRYAAWDI